MACAARTGRSSPRDAGLGFDDRLLEGRHGAVRHGLTQPVQGNATEVIGERSSVPAEMRVTRRAGTSRSNQRDPRTVMLFVTSPEMTGGVAGLASITSDPLRAIPLSERSIRRSPSSCSALMTRSTGASAPGGSTVGSTRGSTATVRSRSADRPMASTREAPKASARSTALVPNTPVAPSTATDWPARKPVLVNAE